jgi:hypothetical protein
MPDPARRNPDAITPRPRLRRTEQALRRLSGEQRRAVLDALETLLDAATTGPSLPDPGHAEGTF